MSGQLDWPAVEETARHVPAEWAGRYRAYPYLHAEMPAALAAADLVIARAGAATLGEFPAVGVPSILAPYPYSGQHQDANADFLTERGAAISIRDAELADMLTPAILGLLDDRPRLASMAAASRRWRGRTRRPTLRRRYGGCRAGLPSVGSLR